MGKARRSSGGKRQDKSPPSEEAGERVCFIEIEAAGETLLWPALAFSTVQEMTHCLSSSGSLTTSVRAKLMAAYLAQWTSSSPSEPVYVLLGQETPNGEQAVFGPNTRPFDIYTHLHLASEQKGNDPMLQQALTEAAPFLGLPSTAPSASGDVHRPNEADAPLPEADDDFEFPQSGSEASPQISKKVAFRSHKSPEKSGKKLGRPRKNAVGETASSGSAVPKKKLGRPPKHSVDKAASPVSGKSGKKSAPKGRVASSKPSNKPKPKDTGSKKNKPPASPLPKTKTQSNEMAKTPPTRNSERPKRTPTPSPKAKDAASVSDSVRILPKFQDVQKILRGLGYKLQDKFYCLPGLDKKNKNELEQGRDYFLTVADLRRYLCAYGHEANDYEFESEADKELLKNWITYATVPGMQGKQEIPFHETMKGPEFHKALLKLGFHYALSMYFPQGEKPKKAGGLVLNGFESLETIRVHLARFGLPPNADRMPSDEYSRLQLHIADCDIDRFTLNEDIKRKDSDPVLTGPSWQQLKCQEHPNSKTDNDGSTEPMELDVENGPTTSHTPAEEVNDSHSTCQDSIYTANAPTLVTNSSGDSHTPPESQQSSEAPPATSHSENELTQEEEEQGFYPLTQPNADVMNDSDSEIGAQEVDSSDDETPVQKPNGPGLAGSTACEHDGGIDWVNPAYSDVGEDRRSPLPHKNLFPGSVEPRTRLADQESQSCAFVQDASDNDCDLSLGDDETMKEAFECVPENGSPESAKVAEELGGLSPASSPGASTSPGVVIVQPPASVSEELSGQVTSPEKEPSSPPRIDLTVLSNKSSSPLSTIPGKDVIDTSHTSSSPVDAMLDDDKADDEEGTISPNPEPEEDGMQVNIQDRTYDYGIEKNDTWDDVKRKLFKFFTWKKGRGLADWLYVAPGGKLPTEGGQCGVDFFDTLEQLQEYAFDQLGWAGDEKFLLRQEANRSSRTGRPKRAVVPTEPQPENAKKRKADSAFVLTKKISPRRSPRKKVRSPSVHQKIPEKKKTVRSKLEACITVLQPQHRVERLATIPTSPMDPSPTTQLQGHVGKVQHFLRGVVQSRGSRGARAGDIACLYVCGAPGVGKSSAVDLACDRIIDWAENQDQEGAPDFCFVNGASVSSSKASQKIMEDIAESMNLTSKSLVKIENLLHERRGRNQRFLILVIDEIDLLLSERGRSNDGAASSGEQALRTFFDWARREDLAFGMVGISNVIGNQKKTRLQQLGMSQVKTVVFEPYRESDLVKIVEERVGSSIIQPAAMSWAAKKVAASSGDARKMLELMASAVDKCLKSLTEGKGRETTLEAPIVSIRHVMLANKETITKYADLIEGLPQMAKVILCVAQTLRETGENWKTMTLGTLKTYCFQGTNYNMYDGEEISIEIFSNLVQQLFDAGLLLSANGESVDVSAHGGNLFDVEVRLGLHLQDVESALNETLLEKDFYRNLQNHVRKCDLENRGRY